MKNVFLLFFLFLFDIVFGLNPKILRILDESLHNNLLSSNQYQNIIEELKQDISCQESSTILEKSLDKHFLFECIFPRKKKTYSIKNTYYTKFFPEANQRTYGISLRFKSSHFYLNQKFNINSQLTNKLTHLQIITPKHHLQIGHLYLPHSFLVGRNYWSLQHSKKTSILSLFSNRNKFRGFFWKFKKPHFTLSSWYSFNNDEPTINFQKTETQFLGLNINYISQNFSIESKTTLQYFNKNNLKFYTLLQAIEIKDFWFHQQFFLATSPISSFHTKGFPLFFSWQWSNSRQKTFILFSQSSSNYWNPLHPYSSRSDSLFSSTLVAHGAGEGLLTWKHKLDFVKYSKNRVLKINPLNINSYAQWVKKNNTLHLYYFTYSQLPIKIYTTKIVFKLKYQLTKEQKFSSFSMQQTWKYQQHTLQIKNEIKSSTYNGSYPFPSSMTLTIKGLSSTFFIEFLTQTTTTPKEKWNIDFGHFWYLNKSLLLENEISLSFEESTLKDNLYYLLKIKGSW